MPKATPSKVAAPDSDLCDLYGFDQVTNNDEVKHGPSVRVVWGQRQKRMEKYLQGVEAATHGAARQLLDRELAVAGRGVGVELGAHVGQLDQPRSWRSSGGMKGRARAS